ACVELCIGPCIGSWGARAILMGVPGFVRIVTAVPPVLSALSTPEPGTMRARSVALGLASNPGGHGSPVVKTISVEDARARMPNGARLMIGGFMGTGTPERILDELVRQEKRDLVVIANDTATPARGIGKLVAAGLVGKAIASHIGLNPDTQKKMIA